jgi:site-specific DNA recombinase
MKETQAKRALAEARLNKPKATRRRLTEEEITDLVKNVDSIMQALKAADRADKADLYSRLQVTLKYHPNEKRVAAEARPASIMYVGACPRGDSQLTYTTPVALTTEFTLDAGGAR